MNGGGFPPPPPGAPPPSAEQSPHRVPGFPDFGMHQKGVPQAGGLGPMYEMNAQFGNFPAQQAMAPYNGQLQPPPQHPQQQQQEDEFGNRHQMMNNRLKSLIQSRQTQKEMLIGPFPVQQMLLSDMSPAGTPPMATFDQGLGPDFSQRDPWAHLKQRTRVDSSEDGESMFQHSMDSQSFQEGLEAAANGVNGNYFYGEAGKQRAEESFEGQNPNSGGCFSPSSSNSSGQSFPPPPPPPQQQQQQHEGNNNGVSNGASNGDGGQFLPPPFSPSLQQQGQDQNFPMPPSAAPVVSNGNHHSPAASPRDSVPLSSANGGPDSKKPPPPDSPAVPPSADAPPVCGDTPTEPQPFLSNTTTSMNTYTSTISTYNSLSSPLCLSSPLPSVSHLFGRYPGDPKTLDAPPKTGGGAEAVDAGRIQADSRVYLDCLPSPFSQSYQLLPEEPMQDPAWWERLERLRSNGRSEAPPCPCYGDERE